MRSIFRLAVLLLLTVPAAAHAGGITQITVLYNGGLVQHFTLPGTPSYSYQGTLQGLPIAYFGYNLPNSVQLTFYAQEDQVAYNNYPLQYGMGQFGPFDFEFFTHNFYYGGTTVPDLDWLYDGPPLYTGSVADPRFTPGIYLLTLDPNSGLDTSTGEVVAADRGPDRAAFIINSTTPEPSSLILLGTGIVAAAGMARRKFLAA